MPTNAKKHFAIPIGTDVQTGEEVVWTQHDLRYGGYLTVAARGGKTMLMSKVLSELVTRGAPAIVIDDASTFWDELKRAVAWKAYRLNHELANLGYPRADRRAIINKKFLNRFSFAFLGSGKNNHVGLDILKRRQLPGRRESIEEVVSGNLRPFEARFKDIEIRTKFLSVIVPSLAALIAAKRPVTELFPLLLDPSYWYFVRAEIIRLRVLDDPESRTYLVPQMQKLRRILDLRKTKNGTVESEPYPQVFRDKTDSTLHAMEVYTPGTRASRMFVEDTFSPERVAFGNSVFTVTSDVGSELNRNLALGTIYTTFERLLKYRLAGFGNSKNRLFLMFDEVRWFFEAITRFFSVTGNHRVSTFVLNQQAEQWGQLGMPAMDAVLPKLLSGLRLRDAAGTSATAEDMALRDACYNPFGLQHRQDSITRTTGDSDSETDTESETDGESSSTGSQYGGSSGYGQNESSSLRDGTGSSYRLDEPLDSTYSSSHDDARGFGSSSSETDSWGNSESHGTSSSRGRSKARGTTRSRGESVVEHILNAGAAEQHLLRKQKMMQLPRFVVQASTPDQLRYVRLHPPVRPCSLAEIRAIVEEFDEGSAAVHAARRSSRKPYDPSITITRAEAPAPAAASTSASTSTSASASASTTTSSSSPASDGPTVPPLAEPNTVAPATHPLVPKPSFTRPRSARGGSGRRPKRRG